MARALVLLWAVAAGCKGVDPAPADLDALLHYVWEGYDAADDTTLHEAVRNLDAAVAGDQVDGPTDGSVTPLTAEQAALVGVTDRNPALAAGVYLVNVIRCPLPDLDTILVHPNQDELYPGIYDSYERAFHTDTAAYLDGSSTIAAWDVTYSASVLGAGYTATTSADLRRLTPIDDASSPWGPVTLARAFMPEPAAFDADNKTLDQDYQLEVYWERSPGEIVHVYGVWRQADWGAGFTSDDEGIQRLMLNALADWDNTTDDLCADGLP